MPRITASDSLPTAGLASPGGRLGWLDAAKGLCILLVVMMHSVLGVEDAMGAAGWLHGAVAFATPFRIPAFFLLAGLLVSRSIDRPWPEFLDRKLVHFAYFYGLWAALQIGFKTGGTLGPAAAFEALARAVVEPFGMLWFIYLLPLFFLTTRLLRRLPAPALLAGAALLEILPIHTGSPIIDEFASRYVWFLAGHFAAGLLAEWAELVRGQKLTAVLLVTIFGAMNGMLVAGGQSDRPGLGLLLGLAGSLALIAVAVVTNDTPAGRLLRRAGQKSLTIYLAFFLPMAALRLALVRSGAGDLIGVGATGLLVWLGAATGPLLLQRLASGTGWRFLFERPGWARLPAAAVRRTAPAE